MGHHILAKYLQSLPYYNNGILNLGESLEAKFITVTHDKNSNIIALTSNGVVYYNIKNEDWIINTQYKDNLYDISAS